jgi:hypothetical protein
VADRSSGRLVTDSPVAKSYQRPIHGYSLTGTRHGTVRWIPKRGKKFTTFLRSFALKSDLSLHARRSFSGTYYFVLSYFSPAYVMLEASAQPDPHSFKWTVRILHCSGLSRGSKVIRGTNDFHSRGWGSCSK